MRQRRVNDQTGKREELPSRAQEPACPERSRPVRTAGSRRGRSATPPGYLVVAEIVDILGARWQGEGSMALAGDLCRLPRARGLLHPLRGPRHRRFGLPGTRVGVDDRGASGRASTRHQARSPPRSRRRLDLQLPVGRVRPGPRGGIPAHCRAVPAAKPGPHPRLPSYPRARLHPAPASLSLNDPRSPFGSI